MQAQQRRFLNVMGIYAERALRLHNIKPMEDFLNEQCVNIVQRILKDSKSINTRTQDESKRPQ